MSRQEFELDANWYRDIEIAAKKLEKRLAKEAAEDARRYCPVRTGKLRGTIKALGNKVVIGGIGAWYWYLIEFGTKPHLIFPKIKKALWWPGAKHPVSGVIHPGTRAYAPMRRAMLKKRL